MYGRLTKVPKGYKGAVILRSEKILEKENGIDHRKEIEEIRNMETKEDEDEDEDDEVEDEVKILEEVGEFREMLVWGHEAVADGEDMYVRSVEEWVGVAESVSPKAIHKLLKEF